jgi:hypothetical protein
MTIEMDNYRQQEPTNLLEKFCLHCPHLYSLERNAGSYRMNQEVQQHRAICPGRQSQARRARTLARLPVVKRGTLTAQRVKSRRFIFPLHDRQRFSNPTGLNSQFYF